VDLSLIAKRDSARDATVKHPSKKPYAVDVTFPGIAKTIIALFVKLKAPKKEKRRLIIA
jgi:hypothetical protein